MSAGFRTIPMLPVMLALTGCGSDNAATFELTLSPVPPPSHADLFDELDTLLVRLSDSTGVLDEYTIEVDRGTSPAIEDLGKLPQGTTIEIEGFAGTGAQATLVAKGTTAELSVGRAEAVALDIFVAPVGELVTFHALDTPSYAAAVASDGTGNFHVFGGTDGLYDSAGLETIDAWTLAPPEDTFQPVTVTTFPLTTDEGWGGEIEITHRVDATATRLDVGDDDDGKILVTGGWEAFKSSPTVTAQVFLFDPSAPADEAIEVLTDLENGRAGHSAMPLGSGEVVILGGYSYDDSSDDTRCTAAIEIWDPITRETTTTDNNAGRCLVQGAAVALDDAALYCGGLNGVSSNTYSAFSDCVMVERWGSVTYHDGPEGLGSAGLLEPAMAALDDNRVVLTGGLEISGNISISDYVDASDRTFIFDGDTQAWDEKATMKVPRAGHVAASLPDGRVLVAGGVSSSARQGIWNEGFIACIEIYDPDQNEWQLLEPGCEDNPQVGSLPAAVHRPSVAVDPYYGVLIWGGLNEEGGDLVAQSSYALYVPEPVD